MDKLTPSFPVQSRAVLVLRRGGWVAVLGFALSLAVMAMQGPGLVTSWRLRWRAAQSIGEVLAVRVEHRGTKQQTIVADYVFTVAEAHRRVTEAVTSRFMVSQKVPGPVVVHYLPDDPSVSEIIPGSRFAGSLTGTAITFVIFFCFAAAWGSRDAKAKARIALGKVAVRRRANVLVHEVTENDRLIGASVRLVWRDESGLVGQSEWRRATLPLPPINSTITIYADPTGQLPSVWEGDCGPC